MYNSSKHPSAQTYLSDSADQEIDSNPTLAPQIQRAEAQGDLADAAPHLLQGHTDASKNPEASSLPTASALTAQRQEQLVQDGLYGNLIVLPDPLLLEILQYVALSDLLKLKLVSSAIAALAMDNSFWRPVVKTQYPVVVPDVETLSNGAYHQLFVTTQEENITYRDAHKLYFFKNGYPQTLSLLMAARTGNLSYIKDMAFTLEDFRRYDQYSKNVIHYATHRNNQEFLNYIYEKFVAPVFSSNGEPKVHIASGICRKLTYWQIACNQSQIIKSMIENPALIGEYRAFHIAAEYGNLPLIKCLFKLETVKAKRIDFLTVFLGGETGLKKWTPLHFAANQGQLEVVKLFVGQGYPRIVPSQNPNPLKSAADGGHIEIVKYLIESGIIDVTQFAYEDLGLVSVISKCFSEKRYLHIVETLLLAGAKTKLSELEIQQSNFEKLALSRHSQCQDISTLLKSHIAFLKGLDRLDQGKWLKVKWLERTTDAIYGDAYLYFKQALECNPNYFDKIASKIVKNTLKYGLTPDQLKKFIALVQEMRPGLIEKLAAENNNNNAPIETPGP